MKWRIVIAVITCLLLLGIIPQKKNFSGNWKLDKQGSAGLPRSFNSVETYQMGIRQTPDSLLVRVELKGNGQDVSFPLVEYRLDGKETTRQDTLRGSKHSSKCTWSKDGKKLTINSTVEQKSMNSSAVLHYRQADTWELAGNDTLRISMVQKFSKPDSVHNERRIFHRVK